MTTGRSDEVIDASGLRLPGRSTPDRALPVPRRAGRALRAGRPRRAGVHPAPLDDDAPRPDGQPVDGGAHLLGRRGAPERGGPAGGLLRPVPRRAVLPDQHPVPLGAGPVRLQRLLRDAVRALGADRAGRRRSTGRAPLYYHVDWHRYRPGALREEQRFHVAWRRENPTQAFGEEYLVLDAVGRGRLVGFDYGVRAAGRRRPLVARRCGEPLHRRRGDRRRRRRTGLHPRLGRRGHVRHVLGGALHRPRDALYKPGSRTTSTRTWGRRGRRSGSARTGSSMPDAIPFERSMHFRFGCVANDICSTSTGIRRRRTGRSCAARMDRLKPGTELRGSVDLLGAAAVAATAGRRGRAGGAAGGRRDGEWWLCGPFEDASGQAMARALPPEEGTAPDEAARVRRRLRSGIALAHPEPGQARAAPGALGAAARRARLRRLRPRLPPLDAGRERAVAGGAAP